MIYSIFIVPLTMILAGFFMYKYTPKKINKIVGYRTSNSMKNQENWNLSNQFCGKLWIKIGVLILIVDILVLFLAIFNILKFTEDIIGVIVLVETIPMIISIFIVENRIKKKGLV